MLETKTVTNGDGRRLQPFCSSGRTARTVTVPPATGVLIRARNVPDTLPANHSVLLLAGTGIVFSVVHTIAGLDPDPGDMGVICGQHSIATEPPVIDPLPVTRNVRKRASGGVTVKPLPVVAVT
jgi:hypothetical protein